MVLSILAGRGAASAAAAVNPRDPRRAPALTAARRRRRPLDSSVMTDAPPFETTLRWWADGERAVADLLAG
ncbi:MAG: hypothetical protein ACXVX0_18915, partial [Blastococcus sp.]